MSLLAPPSASAVIVDTRKFTVVENGFNMGLPQRTGYVAVLDTASVELLFILKIFDIESAEEPARSAQPVPVITQMVLNDDETAILLTTDGGAQYEIDLGGLSVTALD